VREVEDAGDTMKKFLFVLPAFVCLITLIGVTANALTISGAVRQPLNLDRASLLQFGSTQARITELSLSGEYGGVFDYQGVPLKALLEVATVQKEVVGYSKSINLAIVVRNREGKTVALSWGEVFYKNPSHVMLALSASPVFPGVKHKCGECHEASFYKPVLSKLDRKMTFPKLVMANDFNTDRNLEDVISIEIVDLNKEAQYKEGQRPSSATFTVTDSTGRTKTVSGLSGYPQVPVSIKEVGSGKGFHGVKRFEGVPVAELLKKLDVDRSMDSVVLLTSTDGYQSLLSYGEIALSPLGEQIIISETKSNPRKFVLVVPSDTLADRMVKTVNKVEIISLKPKSKIYVIGVGCGDTSLITLDAISHMGRVDAFISPENLTERFAKYMGGKPVLFDPFSSFEPEFKKRNPNLTGEELKKKLEAQHAAEMKSFRDTLAAGKSVAILDYGDPTIYGGWQHWLEPEFAGRLEVVPGISALSAANAMMGYSLACNQDSMIVTTPKALEANQDMLKAVAAKGDPVVIYMGLRDMKTLVPLLKKYYAATTPIVVAYKAGFSKEGRLVKTNLARVLADTEKETEQQLGMIYVGPSLR
jgi:precorrin-4 methylase